MALQLTSGSLETIMAGGTVENPVVQILGSKKMSSNGSSAERYRLLVSDGKHLNSFAMLATQLNEKVESGELSDYSVVRLNRVITSMVNNSGKGQKRVLIILDVTVLNPGSEVGMKIGNPVPYEEGGSGVSPPKIQATSNTYNPPSSHNPTTLQNTNNYSSSVAATNGNAQMTATHPIASLNPYQNRWTIKARCTAKTPVKKWSNARSEGQLFSMEFLDESGEIRCTAFKEAVDKYYDLIEIGKVYLISNCTLKPANKQYTQVKHEYEMTVTQHTMIVECPDACTNIPEVIYDFKTIEQVEALDEGSFVDLIGICKSAQEATTLTARATGKDFTKRDICLVDETKRSITATLWAEAATSFDASDNPVVAIKGARLKTFNGGKTISLATMPSLNPDIPEAHRLRGWFENEGSSVEWRNVSGGGGTGGRDNMSGNFTTLADMRAKNLGSKDVPDYIMVKATIGGVHTDRALYQACPQATCNKKVIDQGNGHFRCEKCNQEFSNFKYRLLARFNICDIMGNQWVNCFHEQSEEILGVAGEELGQLQQNDQKEFEDVFKKATFQSYVFKLRVKDETYNDASMLRVVVMAVQKPMDYKKYNMHLINEIKRMSGMVKPE